MKPFLQFTFLLGICLLVSGCAKNKVSKKDADAAANSNKKLLSGYAQKGPFLSGSSITVFELDSTYTQTGNAYSAQIRDEAGNFQVSVSSLVSSYALIRAQGFYFNEVCGINSESQITLNCIADVSGTNQINVNILTELERERVEYLIAGGMTFSTAKQTAQQEVFAMFSFTPGSAVSASEQLTLSAAGDGNAMLLAVSVIIQGMRKSSDLTSILSKLSSDLKTDGVLSNVTLQTSLIDHAKTIDTIAIRNHLVQFYADLGISAVVPNFETYVQQFISSTTFTASAELLDFPASHGGLPNLLYKSQTLYPTSAGYCFYVKSRNCVRLKIGISGTWNVSGAWGGTYATFLGWNAILAYTVIKVANPEAETFLNTITLSPGIHQLDYYYNETDSVPTFSKTITVF